MKVFQSNISYSHIIASCLPGIGPFFSSYHGTKTTHARQKLENQLETKSLIDDHCSRSNGCRFFGSELTSKLESERVELLNKMSDYSKCGFISSLVTVVALGILSGSLGISLAVGLFSILTIYNFGGLSKAKNLLKQDLDSPSLQTPDSQ